MRQRTIQRRRERAAKAATFSPVKASRSVVALSLLLVVGTLILYSPVRTHDFINYDDKDYILDNPHITAGLSWQTLRWSLTANEQANWHPLTWLSHALDCQLFGLDAGDHHITSLVLHALNVLLLFLLLYLATGMPWRSFLVAALFAWHPFNAQSVAWVAERKNLLSTLFFLLALGAYGWYARKPQWQRLALVVCVFVLALASKPMAVTLPFVLLLLDYWPLQRIAGWTDVSPRFSAPQQPPWRLVAEKLPLFALSALSCVITVWAQRSGGALRSLQQFSLGLRLENAIVSYVLYILKMFWPLRFSVYYPLDANSVSFWKAAAALVLLLTVSFVLWKQRVARPYLLVGWLWFVGTLVPVIGIVQVGDQAMADRYAYLPLIGSFIALVWGASDFCQRRRLTAPAWGFAAAAVLALCLLTLQQLRYWQNSATIWTRALDVTNGNLLVEKQLANALVMSRETDQALPHLVNIARRDPNDTTTHVNLGACYAAQGRIREATQEFEKVIELTDHKNLGSDERRFRTSAFLNLGFAYARSRDFPKALANFQGASDFDSPMVDSLIADFEHSLSSEPKEGTYLTLSLLLSARGKESEAASILQDAIRGNPDYVDTRNLLQYLSTQPRLNQYLLDAGAMSQRPS